MKIITIGKTAALFAGAILLTALVSGCISTPVIPQRPAAMPALRADDATVAVRKAELGKIGGDSAVRGVMVYPGSWLSIEADEVIAKVASYKFNRIYFVISSEDELDGRLEELFESAAKAGIPAYIAIRQRDYFPRFRGNAFVRLFKSEYPDMVKMAENIADFADSLGDGAKVAGFTILLEPHRFNAAEQRNGGIDGCFVWSGNTFGIGLDNDALMNKTLDDAAKAAKKANGINFTPAIADFYHEWASEGKLSRGKIDEISALSTGSKEVLLFSSGNKPTAVAAGIKNEFSDAKLSRITLVFLVADHLSLDNTVFRRRNFKDYLHGMRYGLQKLNGKKAYNGFVTGPLRALEYMCHEKE
ncbi:MAG: hypothetical protein IJC21_07480 [Lentisphaeria bacterium]|nr:hypothetical protein [Lentisphaeria bacterium]